VPLSSVTLAVANNMSAYIGFNSPSSNFIIANMKNQSFTGSGSINGLYYSEPNSTLYSLHVNKGKSFISKINRFPGNTVSYKFSFSLTIMSQMTGNQLVIADQGISVVRVNLTAKYVEADELSFTSSARVIDIQAVNKSFVVVLTQTSSSTLCSMLLSYLPDVKARKACLSMTLDYALISFGRVIPGSEKYYFAISTRDGLNLALSGS
jgi:hypothetical protein